MGKTWTEPRKIGAHYGEFSMKGSIEKTFGGCHSQEGLFGLYRCRPFMRVVRPLHIILAVPVIRPSIINIVHIILALSVVRARIIINIVGQLAHEEHFRLHAPSFLVDSPLMFSGWEVFIGLLAKLLLHFLDDLFWQWLAPSVPGS